MLELKNIRKAYVTAGFTQVALDDVSVAFRDNEFVAVLGPSGSGKTTMLNILGGLDHADSGDIVINGISTKDYTDKDWDTYRNHRIGFIFQSYNLIPHQTVLSNVELALTLSGVSRAERRERACAALERVGLAEHVNKLPSQLSGGQMQRVAIARALVNDPDIVLADEPTGALDTETGIQVMDLLKEIADERLVIMVTHNPELAEQYATRIVRLKDGNIIDDTDPITAALPERSAGFARTEKPNRHASMSLLTALSLSFNNLMTKKGRTFMTAFAGSIGIIGIAAILALSNGVNDYIAKTEEEALSSYPLIITKSSFDMTNLMVARMGVGEDAGEGEQNARLIEQDSIMTDMFAQVKNNDLKSFRSFLMSDESGIGPYVSTIQYSYGLQPNIYKADGSQDVMRLNPSRMGQTLSNGLSGSAFLGGSSMSSFTELIDDQNLLDQSLELIEGRWPSNYDECVFVLGSNGAITDYTLYSLGFYDISVMDDMTMKVLSGEEVEVPDTYEPFTMDDAMNMHFSVVPACNLYQKNTSQGTWTDMSEDRDFMRSLLASDNVIDLHVVGVVKQADGASGSLIPEGIAYTPAMTLRLMKLSEASDIVREQRSRPAVDVFTGKTFDELQHDENRNFSLEDTFKIDEEAISQAFNFDASAMEGLGSGMSFEGMDLSSAFGSMDLSAMDFSGLDTSAFADVFDADTMSEMMNMLPAYSGEGLDVAADLADLDVMSMLAPAASQLVDGFADWAAETGVIGGEKGEVDVAAIINDYLASDKAKSIISSFEDELANFVGPEKAQELSNLLTSYFRDELTPYLTQALDGIDLSTLTADELRQIIAQAPTLNLEAISKIIGLEILQQAAAETANELAADFAAWLIKNPSYILGTSPNDPKSYGELVNRYLKTDSAQQIMGGLSDKLGGEVQQAVVDAVSDSLKQYMNDKLSPYFSLIMGEVMSELAGTLAQQLGEAFFTELTLQMSDMSTEMASAIASQLSGQMGQLSDIMDGALSIDGEAFANAIQFNMTQEDLRSLLTNFLNADELTYEANLSKLGFGEQDSPESISIYPKDFDAKESVLEIVDGYNSRMQESGQEESVIQYSDFMGVLMSSVTDIVNTISLVLIAFVSISLVVSSIMISIITYISVLERKKEIGILRAMGASKFNVANIFNAETVIEGFFAGMLAVTVVYLVSFPVNEMVYRLKDVPNIMQLKPENATALVLISVLLTLIAGLIPSSAASRRDPVEALRSE